MNTEDFDFEKDEAVIWGNGPVRVKNRLFDPDDGSRFYRIVDYRNRDGYDTPRNSLVEAANLESSAIPQSEVESKAKYDDLEYETLTVSGNEMDGA